MTKGNWYSTDKINLFVICYFSILRVTTGDHGGIDTTTDPVQVTVRLVGVSYSGRVEVFHDGIWGTICNDLWELVDGDVVCRQLGFPGAVSVYTIGESYGVAENRIWLDDVRCTGNEERIENCNSLGWGEHNCQHSEDAAVECMDSGYCQVNTPCGENALCRNVGTYTFKCICENGWSGVFCEEGKADFKLKDSIYLFVLIPTFILIFIYVALSYIRSKVGVSSDRAPVHGEVNSTVPIEGGDLELPAYDQIYRYETEVPPPKYEDAILAMNRPSDVANGAPGSAIMDNQHSRTRNDVVIP